MFERFKVLFAVQSQSLKDMNNKRQKSVEDFLGEKYRYERRSEKDLILWLIELMKYAINEFWKQFRSDNFSLFDSRSAGGNY